MSTRFAEEGAIVVCQDLDEAAAARTVDAIAALGGAASGVGVRRLRQRARSTRCSTTRRRVTVSSTCS